MSDPKALKAEIWAAIDNTLNCDQEVFRVDDDGTVHVRHRHRDETYEDSCTVEDIDVMITDLERAAKAIRELRRQQS